MGDALILVTGATGFLGGKLVELLVAGGHQVRALVRKTSRTQKLEALNVEIAVGSLETGEGILPALEGVTHILHCAGGGKVLRRRDFTVQNTLTTETLLNAAAEVGSLERFVLVSSLAAYGPSPSGEFDPSRAETPVSLYGKAKREAEKLAEAAAEHFPVTIIRPPAVFGPGDNRMIGLYRTISRGWKPMVAPNQRLSVVFVDDCAEALVRCIEVPHGHFATYFVAHPEVLTQRELMDHIASAVGRSARTVRMPASVLWCVATLNELRSKVTRKSVALTRDKVGDMRQKAWVCPSNAIQEDLGWSPTVTFSEGAARAATWYRENDWM